MPELSADKLRKICSSQSLGCNTSEELKTTKAIIGQNRAAKALQLGLGIRAAGFNVYVAGLPGTGRTTAVTRFLGEMAKDKPVPPDWCYVNNFRDLSRPNAIRLPAGRAREFQADMKTLVEKGQRGVRAAFESEDYTAKREATIKTFQQQKNGTIERVKDHAQKAGFLIQASPAGIMTIPLKKGRALSEQEFLGLS